MTWIDDAKGSRFRSDFSRLSAHEQFAALEGLWGERHEELRTRDELENAARERNMARAEDPEFAKFAHGPLGVALAQEILGIVTDPDVPDEEKPIFPETEIDAFLQRIINMGIYDMWRKAKAGMTQTPKQPQLAIRKPEVQAAPMPHGPVAALPDYSTSLPPSHLPANYKTCLTVEELTAHLPPEDRQALAARVTGQHEITDEIEDDDLEESALAIPEHLVAGFAEDFVRTSWLLKLDHEYRNMYRQAGHDWRRFNENELFRNLSNPAANTVCRDLLDDPEFQRRATQFYSGLDGKDYQGILDHFGGTLLPWAEILSDTDAAAEYIRVHRLPAEIPSISIGGLLRLKRLRAEEAK